MEQTTSMNAKFRRPARISRIGAGPSPLARGARQGQRRRCRQGGQATCHQSYAHLSNLMLMMLNDLAYE
eukprot:3727976-Pyramimonas_sp.AAC.1